MEKNVVLMKIVVVTIVIFALTSVAMSVGAESGCTQFEVPPTGQWTSSWFGTGISVTSGQTISITASGTVQPSTAQNIFAGPDGTFEVDYWQTSYSFRSDWGHEALIARIGASGDLIFIGTSTTFTAPTGGEVWLGVNDKDPGNNAGGFVVNVCLDQAPAPDSDGDGVPDDKDKCLGTPAGVAVDDKGCPEEKPISALQKIHQMNMDMINKLKNKPTEIEKKQDVGMTIFKDPSVDQKTIKLENGEIRVDEIKPKIEKTQSKIKEIAQKKGLEKVEVKTMQGTDIRIVQKDENVPVKKDEQSGLYFKSKYNFNKHIVDKVIDAVADKIPLGLGKMCKDYIKSDKDTNVYSDDENVKRTQVELDVPKKNAELYQMNEFRDREKKYLPITNLVSSNKLTKSVGYIIKCFGNSVSRTYASYSRQEYEEVKELAKKRREDYKLTWTETIKGVIDVMADTSVDKRTQHLDVNSKDQKGGVFNFKTQEGRIKFYIQMMRKGGELE
jgi:hypothetical protein